VSQPAAVRFALGVPIDASFILMFVILGTSLNVVQEYKASSAVDQLKSYLVGTATVRRDGHDLEVPAIEVVPGDLLVLQAGDIVAADVAADSVHRARGSMRASSDRKPTGGGRSHDQS